MIAVAAFQAFLLFAGVVSYEDWRRRKILNLRIVQGLLACGLFLAWLLLNSALGHGRVRFLGVGEYYFPWAYYPKVAAHLALSVAAGLGFWRLDVWPAGDAKFFIVTSLFLVIVEPNLPGFPFLLFLVMLINIFVPAGLFFAGETLVRGAAAVPGLFSEGWRNRLKAFVDRCAVRARDAWPHRWGYALLWVDLLLLFIGLRFAQQELMRLPLGPLGQTAVFLGMMLAWPQLSALLSRRAVGLAVLALAAAALAGAFAALGWRAWYAVEAGARMTFNFGLFLSGARMVLQWWIEAESLREARTEALQAGDVISEGSWEELNKESGGKLGGRYCDGLTEEEAASLRALAARTAVYRTIPFAVWIFLGALLTLTTRTTVVPVILELWRAHAR